MNITAALNSAAEVLRDSGVDEPRRQASSLMTFVLDRDASFLVAHPDYELTPAEIVAYEAAVARRSDREPFQYIVGKQEFYGLNFEVSPDVLIPRPETEILVEAAIKNLAGLSAPKMLEIGVGSGCISISILHSVRTASGLAVDISEKALAVAGRNADKNLVADRLTLERGDVFEGIEGGFDLIVSNPPYVPDEQLAQLQAEVRDFEPHTALSGGPGGLDIVERIVHGAARFLVSGGYLLMEIGFDQSERVDLLFNRDYWHQIEFLRDLQGIPRIVSAWTA